VYCQQRLVNVQWSLSPKDIWEGLLDIGEHRSYYCKCCCFARVNWDVSHILTQGLNISYTVIWQKRLSNTQYMICCNKTNNTCQEFSSASEGNKNMLLSIHCHWNACVVSDYQCNLHLQPMNGSQLFSTSFSHLTYTICLDIGQRGTCNAAFQLTSPDMGHYW